jgi:transcriptional regulator with XRE-family HTH domain
MNWQKLLTELQEHGLTQVQIAEKCNSKQSTISDLARGDGRAPRYALGIALVALHKRTVKRKATA